MRSYSKAVKKKMSHLAGLAHQREQEEYLAKLAEKFDAWRKKEIDCWDLTDAIHQFHQKDAQNVYKVYDSNDDYDIQVARGIRFGLLKREEVDEDVLTSIEDLLRALDDARGNKGEG
ncbi:MAG: hypothetical protein JRI91_14595 [Deltaproteobacteria bacterium]|nr:hypothetical protein [Deltaproteobacteria bacterium]